MPQRGLVVAAPGIVRHPGGPRPAGTPIDVEELGGGATRVVDVITAGDVLPVHTRQPLFVLT
jgi:hypothetical protein